MDRIRTGWQREFFQAPNEIYDRRDISGYARAVFIYLCRRADDESRAFPSYARIAEDVGFSLSTVRRAIESLTETGLMHKEARYDGRGFQTSNIYTLIRPSSVPERGQASAPEAKGTGGIEPGISKEPGEKPGEKQGVLKEQIGCSAGAGGVLSENSPDVLAEQLGCSVGTGRMFCENSKEDPSYKYPDEEYSSEKYPVYKNQSVRHSINQGGKAFKEATQNDGQIDFSNFEITIKHYIDKYKATRNQVVKAMVSVQAQLDRGAIIMDSKAYFEKTLTQVMQEDDFRRHFV